MATLAEQIISRTEMRRRNGECEYGPWMPATDAPARARDAIADEIAESGERSGQIEVGGQAWVYRPVSPDAIGQRIGRAMARDTLADDLPREWAGLSPEDGDQLTAAGIEPDTPEWSEAERAAYLAAIRKA